MFRTMLTDSRYDFARQGFDVADIDATSEKFAQLFRVQNHDATQESQTFELQRIASARLLKLIGTGSAEPSIGSIFDAILQNWVTPLPPRIPVQIRLTKERLARRIATDVMLASSRIRVTEPPPPAEAIESQAGTSQDWTMSLPVHPGKGRAQNFSIPSSSIPSSSIPYLPSSPPRPHTTLPTPEPTPSLASGTTFTSSFSSPNAQTHNPIARLTKHLTITNPPITTPPSVNQVLLHWQLGADPNTYDWEATTRSVHESLHIDDEASATRRAKLQRKAERHLKRQRRETAIMQRKVESQPVIVRETGLRSSPGPRTAGFGGSSQTQSQSQSQGFGLGFVVASQVERGTHGGRLGSGKVGDGKKKQKKRGF